MTTAQLIALAVLSCFLQSVPQVDCGSAELLQDWQNINSNPNSDIQQSNDIYRKIKEEQAALHQLRRAVERRLKIKNADLLVNAISSYNITTPANNLKALVGNFQQNYNKEMIEGIFAEAINEITGSANLTQLPNILWNIYQQNDTNLFEFMLRAQVKLYSSVSKLQHPSEKEFTRSFAHRLYKIKEDAAFDGVDLSLKLKVQEIVQKLPTTLKYLYFSPYFCLLNSEYSTYIYTAIDAKAEAGSRFIWLWHDSKSMDSTGYVKAEVGEYNGNKLSAALKSVKYETYYYMMQGKMRIGGWDSTGEPLNYIWNIEFLNNGRVAFSQNEYVMCAVENYDKERRNVAGRMRENPDKTSAECQWHIQHCTF